MKKACFVIFFFTYLSIYTVAQSGFQNPVIPGFYPDPSVCRVGDDYYLVTSTFEYFPGVPIFHSKDLVNWQQIGHCLTRKSQLNLDRQKYSAGIYAPTIRHHDGVFYMVTTHVGSKGNFYVTATDPAGEWSDPIWVKQSGIDPTIYWDEDGKVYFVSVGAHKEGIIMSEIDIATGKLLTEPRPVWSGTGGRYPEAPHLYKKDGYYYLLISEGGTEYAHKVTIARSRNIRGPYEGCPHNPILTHCSEDAQFSPIQGTGHADLVEAVDGSWWMVFLAFRPQDEMHHLLGRETFLAPVGWSGDHWPIVNGGRPVALEMNVTTLSKVQSQEVDQTDNFDSGDMGLEWIYLRNPDRSYYSLNERKGFLRLIGDTITLDQNDSPTFVGRRQQHINFEATVVMDYNIKNENDEAGLTVYMNPFSHYDLYITQKSNKNMLCLRYRLGNITHIEKEIEIEDKSAELRIVGTAGNYSFLYLNSTGIYEKIGKANTRYLSTETAGGFTGIVLGMYVVSNDRENPSFADFDRFEYKGL